MLTLLVEIQLMFHRISNIQSNNFDNFDQQTLEPPIFISINERNLQRVVSLTTAPLNLDTILFFSHNNSTLCLIHQTVV